MIIDIPLAAVIVVFVVIVCAFAFMFGRIVKEKLMGHYASEMKPVDKYEKERALARKHAEQAWRTIGYSNYQSPAKVIEDEIIKALIILRESGER